MFRRRIRLSHFENTGRIAVDSINAIGANGFSLMRAENAKSSFLSRPVELLHDNFSEIRRLFALLIGMKTQPNLSIISCYSGLYR